MKKETSTLPGPSPQQGSTHHHKILRISPFTTPLSNFFCILHSTLICFLFSKLFIIFNYLWIKWYFKFFTTFSEKISSQVQLIVVNTIFRIVWLLTLNLESLINENSLLMTKIKWETYDCIRSTIFTRI